MSGWRDLWPYAHTWWGWTVGIVSILIGIFTGPKLVLETYEWYMDRFFDSKVREFLETHVALGSAVNGQQTVSGIPKSVPEIAAGTGLSEKRVKGCLVRLQKKKLVSKPGEQWKIA